MSCPLSVSMSVLGGKAGQAWARGADSDRGATAQARDVCRCRRLVLEDSWSPAAAGALAARGRVRAPRGWTHACIALSSIVGAMGRMWVRLWEKMWGYGRLAGGTHAGERRRCGVMRGCICPSRDWGRCDPGHWCTPGPEGRTPTSSAGCLCLRMHWMQRPVPGISNSVTRCACSATRGHQAGDKGGVTKPKKWTAWAVRDLGAGCGYGRRVKDDGTSGRASNGRSHSHPYPLSTAKCQPGSFLFVV